jgi:S-methylmethionine-dependent homocysteine/selenocysteine methylase
MSLEALRDSLDRGELIVMDGGTGTEVRDRGIDLTVPLWSATALLSHEGREALADVHEDFIRAGAGIIITNTFRTHRNTFEEAGRTDSAEATQDACDIALDARIEAGFSDTVVAGSTGPLKDCYRPQDTPPNDVLRREHEIHARNLEAGGVDLILAETMITLRETEAALSAGQATGIPLAVCFCTEENGTSLLSGESMDEAVRLVDEFDPVFVGVNCVDIHTATRAVRHLAALGIDRPIAVYAQGEDRAVPHKLQNVKDLKSAYLEEAKRWIDLGAQIVGGCCGVNPSYIRGINRLTLGQGFPLAHQEGNL